jgi:hypothetical protein
MKTRFSQSLRFQIQLVPRYAPVVDTSAAEAAGADQLLEVGLCTLNQVDP